MQRFTTAALLPWLSFFAIKRSAAAFMCLLLQLSLIGWVPASIWAIRTLRRHHQTHQRIAKAVAQALRLGADVSR